MRYLVSFQQIGFNGVPRSQKDAPNFEGAVGMLPNVGDYVQVITSSAGNPSYSGRVRSRHFIYSSAEECEINRLVEDGANVDWGAIMQADGHSPM